MHEARLYREGHIGEIESRKQPGQRVWVSTQGYLYVNVGGKSLVQHRYIWEQAYGKIPKGFQIHHIDGNPKNNGLSNLLCISFEEHKKLHKAREVPRNK